MKNYINTLVAKINLFGSTEDLKEQIAYIENKFPCSALYAAGSSAGTGLLVRYLGEVGADTPIKAAFALCPGYNTETGFANVHPLYSKFMAKKLFEKFISPYQDVWSSLDSLQKVIKAKTLAEFDQLYYEMAGYTDYQTYTQMTNPIYVFKNIEIPLLILNAEDDPVCHIKNFEPYKQAIQNMNTIAVITTRKGSHCGFYEGALHTKSWAHQLMADFFRTYHRSVVKPQIIKKYN